MKIAFICSPYRGNVEYNTSRAQGYCRFAYSKGYAPYAPHLHNPCFLDEAIPEERDAGINLGLQLLTRSDELWIFGDKLTEGMEQEFKVARQMKIPIRYFTDRCEEREVNQNE